MKKSPQIEEIETQQYAVENIILIREDGILRVWAQKDLKPWDWQYRITNATGQFTLIDIDHGKAMPLVKSILNDLSLFPELRILRVIEYTLFATSLILILMGTFTIMRSPNKADIADFGKNVATAATNAKLTTSPIDQIKQAIQSQSINRALTWAQTR